MVQALEDALCMSEEERRERHRQNYMHVATHTAQVEGRGVGGFPGWYVGVGRQAGKRVWLVC
jgi:hypothetical protein